MSQKWLMVFQTHSPIRRHSSQRQTLRGLGLNGIRRGRVLPDTPEIRGMIRKVGHLVHVIEGNLLGAETPRLTRDLIILRRFNRRVTRTEQSAFWKQYEDQIPNAVTRFDNVQFEQTGPATFAIQGVVHSFLEDFNQDQIAAFVLDYRQYTQNNDAISIGSLARIYHRAWMHSGARQNFDTIRARHNQSLDASSGIMFGDYSMSVRELVDIVIYGGLAHSNAEKAAIFESWEKSGIMGFVWASFFAAMRDLMKALKVLRKLNEQILSFAPPDA